MAAGVTGSGVAFLVIYGATEVVSAPASKAGHSFPFERTMGENSGASG